MPVLPLEDRFVYGPIRSRRVGLSLGVNLLPLERKACSFSCIYCHYGPTERPSLRPSVETMPWPAQVVRAVESSLRRHPNVDSITFSGNGEPTLHPAFPQIVADVRRLRDRLCPDARMVLFSNSSGLGLPGVTGALCDFEMAMMKLDAGDGQTFAAVDRPAPGITVDHIVSELQRMPEVMVQTMLVGGPISNTHERALDAWMKAIAAVDPSRVYLYSADYPTADAAIERVPPRQLEQIACELRRRTGAETDAVWLRA